MTKINDEEKSILIPLSDKFTRPWIKKTSIIISMIISIVLVLYLIFFYKSKTISCSVFIILSYIVISSLYDFYFLKSKEVSFTNNYIVIYEKNNIKEKVALKDILKIKRKLFYFYKIQYKNKMGGISEVFIFISSNPPLSESKKIKQLKRFIYASIS